MSTCWSQHLSDEQIARCKKVMAHAKSFTARMGQTAYQDKSSDHAMEGWTVLISPSTGPAKMVRCRYRDILGRLLIDEDCS